MKSREEKTETHPETEEGRGRSKQSSNNVSKPDHRNAVCTQVDNATHTLTVGLSLISLTIDNILVFARLF